MVTWLPRCSATMPRRRSTKARFCPYCPNRTDASLLSSNASTVCVVAVSSEVAPGGITESVVRKGVSSSCCSECGRALFSGQRAKKAVTADFGDGHAPDRADQRCWRHNLDCLQVWRAAHDLPGQSPWLFQQHINCAVGKTSIKRALVASDSGLQPLQAIGFFFLGHLIIHLGRRRSRSRRIHERKRAGETDLVHEGESLTEVCFGFARKPHDKIGREREIGTAGPQARKRAKIVSAGVFSVHSSQNAIGPRLKQPVHIRHWLGGLRRRRPR